MIGSLLKVLLFLILGICFSGDPAFAQTYRAVIKPAEATILMAPRNEIKANNSASSSSSVKLKWRLEKSRFVKAKELICSFQTSRRSSWFSRADRMIRRLKTQAREKLQKIEEQVQAKQVGLERLKIELQQVELKKIARDVMPFRDFERLLIDIENAKLEIQSTFQRLETLRERKRQLQHSEQINIDDAIAERAYLEEQLDRFEVRAPHDGYVYFPKLSKFKRPVRIDDYFAAGSPVVWLAKDQRQIVEFYVPEFHFQRIQSLERFSVRSSDGRISVQARKASTNLYPQVLTYLLDDPAIPGGQEKYFIVRGEFLEKVPEVGEGVELTVEIPSREGH